MVQARTAPTLADLRAKREEILRVATAHGASNVRVIGSVARGDTIPTSDFDFLMDFDKNNIGGFAYFGRIEELRLALEDILGRSVDIVDAGGLNTPRIRDRMLAEAVPL